MAHISVFGLHAAYLLGFERIADVRGIKSIRNLLAKSANDSDKPMSFCGIYLQIRPHERLYIGQTTNLPARFERHIAQGVIIEELAFKPMDADDLDREEKRLIALAQKHGLTLDNLALREKDEIDARKFSDFFTDQDIERWLDGNDKTEDTSSFRTVYDAMAPSLRHQLDLAMSEAAWKNALDTSRHFVKHLIPKPEETNGHLWSCTAYGKKLDEPYIPIIRLYANTQILLSVGFCRDHYRSGWGYLWCDEDSLLSTWDSIERFQSTHPYMKVTPVDGGFLLWSSCGHLRVFVERHQTLLRRALIEPLKKRSLRENNSALGKLLTT